MLYIIYVIYVVCMDTYITLQHIYEYIYIYEYYNISMNISISMDICVVYANICIKYMSYMLYVWIHIT